MPKNNSRMSRSAGLPPGTLIHIGEQKTEKIKITIINYDEAHYTEKELGSVEETYPFKNSPGITWINIDGIHQLNIIEKIGRHYGLHPLVQEDIVNTSQRPKMEEFEDYLFIVLKMIYLDKQRDVVTEQVSLVVGTNFVISFQEEKIGDVFDPIRALLKSEQFRIKKMGADYLAYLLIDAVVDGYFAVLEKEGESIDRLEDKLLAEPKPATLQAIHQLKRKMIILRKSVWPLREAINWLQRTESPLLKNTTKIYLRDAYDHTIQVIDAIEMYRDTLSGLTDIYLSSISNKLNEVMKVLTIIATIFIPLTYISGVYGMNFKYMPELQWPLGYFIVLGFMAIVALLMIFYFRKKKWI
ncbi:MAG: magnesium/cobalt transporter CorA [Candidatus Margulisbacteria bacterium]|nr:magnesium/cobalt transporter CorA [Candidatus Margulisiibacteriota bacterium]